MSLTYVCDECKQPIDERLRITVDNYYLRTTHLCSVKCVLVWTAKTGYLKPTAAGADDDIERLAREIHLARIVSGATDVADWDETTDAYRTRRRIEATQLMISGYAKPTPPADEVVDAEVYCGSLSPTEKNCDQLDGHPGPSHTNAAETWAVADPVYLFTTTLWRRGHDDIDKDDAAAALDALRVEGWSVSRAADDG